MKNLLVRLYREESGATAVEYAIIAALVGVASIFAINQFGEEVQVVVGDVLFVELDLLLRSLWFRQSVADVWCILHLLWQ